MAMRSSVAVAIDLHEQATTTPVPARPAAPRRTPVLGPAHVRIDPETERAWCGERLLDLTPKTFAVLRHFVAHPQRLITKDEMFTAVWGDTVVSEAALTSCIRDLRRALADPSRAPRYIETAHRRGFRFIGPVGIAAPTPPAPSRSQPIERAATFVGRDGELARLHAAFEQVWIAQRRLVFVTGEAGIGKTTLVETFVSQLGAGVRIARGQCIERHGAVDSCAAVIEALVPLTRGPGGDALVATFRQYAPGWLAQMPGLLTDDELESVRRRTPGPTRDRMLRELVDALDVVSAETPLVLVLEDLHWSDPATAGLLAMIARRREKARLLVGATYRPAEVAISAHPLKAVKQELQLHGHCDEIALDFLSEDDVAAYLAGRFPNALLDTRAARFLHRNTSGNPLFLVNVIDHLLARGHVRKVDGRWELAGPVDAVMSDVPDTLWQLVDTQIERLTLEERKVLAVASMAGAACSAALPTITGLDVQQAEECCATLARTGQFLRADGLVEWPDGTVAGRYVFIHALYRKVIEGRMSIGHRVWLHRHIGERLERAWGRRAHEIADELAVHFEHGRDSERAAAYRREASVA
jgi:DNA-binding winged helix-turn-helix (wHTH) protein